MANDVVYLDHAATTPMRAEAIAAMGPFLNVQYANPSGSHRFARDARKVLDECRDDVADVFGCHAGEIIFTGGGTEGANATILGAIRRLQSQGVATQAVCSASEHHAVNAHYQAALESFDTSLVKVTLTPVSAQINSRS